MRPKPTRTHKPKPGEPVLVKQKKKRRTPDYAGDVLPPTQNTEQQAAKKLPDQTIESEPIAKQPSQLATSEEQTQQYANTGADDYSAVPTYQITQEDEFRNVWGSSERN